MKYLIPLFLLTACQATGEYTPVVYHHDDNDNHTPTVQEVVTVVENVIQEVQTEETKENLAFDPGCTGLCLD